MGTMRILGGKLQNQLLQVPKGSTVRPTLAKTRAALFNICQQQIEGATLLDLFAGSGAIGIEALSRGASHVTFVERDPRAYACLKQNIERLGLEQECTLVRSDALEALPRFAKAEKTFSLIYIDPPYAVMDTWKGREVALGVKALLWIDASDLVPPGGSVFLESPRGKLPEETLRQLVLKKTHRYGNTMLYHFVKPLSPEAS